MKSSNIEASAIHLSELALRLLPEIKGKKFEDRFSKALKFASRLHAQAVDHVNDTRTDIGERSIQSLIEGGQLGRSKEIDSVLENRIYPRLPTSRDLDTCRRNFNPKANDTHKAVRQKAIAAVTASGMRESKVPATVLGLLGWKITKERVQDTKKLDWTPNSLERALIQPSNPPDLESLSYFLDQAVDEFIHLRLQQVAPA